ncbi:hypothetical protein QB607_003236 [Clostridium botulinum]|nr:hypothetical protein [Clostridium botulinum]EKS4395909.1 hypothetical protein [Clostridium botulinum]
MSLDNVQLWFARDKDNKIVTINEVDKENKEKYYCPLCNSEIIPRQGEVNSWCFAHIDKSKCSSESMYHFWIKNKLLQKGDKFKIQTDIEREYICNEILVEESYNVGDKEYRPDLTVKTTDGDIIYFEMNYTNEKKLEDYLDIWIGLGNTVVEVDVKTLINSESGKLPVFKAKYYNGKCFNVKRKNNSYYNIIGKHKERLMEKGEYDSHKKDLERLDWLWKDVVKYKQKEVDIEYMTNLIDSVENEVEKELLKEVLSKPRCNDLYYDYLESKSKKIYKVIKEIANKLLLNEINKYIKNSYRGISILDPSDNCYCFYEISRYSEKEIIENCERDLGKIIEHKKEEEKKILWYERRKKIENDILNNKEIQEYKNTFETKNPKYKIEYNIIPFYYGKYSKNELEFSIELTFENGVVAERKDMKFNQQNYNVKEFYHSIVEITHNYFKNIDKITESNLIKFHDISKRLQNRYKKTRHNINVKNSLWLEDTYKIEINDYGRKSLYLSESYYLSNNGILMDCRKKELLLDSLDEEDITNYIVDATAYKIRNSLYR